MTDFELGAFMDTARRRYEDLTGDGTEVPLDAAIQEFAATLEELQVAHEELQVQNEELAAAWDLIEKERKRYRELFEGAPDAYLITNSLGVIEDANARAASLLATPQHYLVGAPLAGYVTDHARRTFRQELDMVRRGADEREWTLPLRTGKAGPTETWFRVTAQRDESGTITSLRWLIRPTGGRGRVERTFEGIRRRAAGELPAPDHALQFIAEAGAELGALIDEVDGAAILSRDDAGATTLVAASDDRGEHLASLVALLPEEERESIAAGEPALIEDTSAATVPKPLGAQAERVGIRALLAFPFRVDEPPGGILMLYAKTPTVPTEDDTAAGQVLAEITGDYLAACRALTDERRLSAQLQQALDSRIVIEQAKGHLAERLGCSPDEAFLRMRQHARANNRRLHEVAGDVIRGRSPGSG